MIRWADPTRRYASERHCRPRSQSECGNLLLFVGFDPSLPLSLPKLLPGYLILLLDKLLYSIPGLLLAVLTVYVYLVGSSF